MNRIGLDLNAVGNHEFDEGARELLRMQRGGCHPVDGCQDGNGFAGADFDFLAANVVDEDTGRTLFPAYAIKRFRGVKVGFIGMTLEGTPNIVSPAGVAGLRFEDEAETANKYAEVLRRRHGVRAIVVLLHEGGSQTPPVNIDKCAGISRADRRHRLAHDHTGRPVRHGPHALGLQLRDRRAAGDERELVRAADHRRSTCGSAAARATSCRSRTPTT